jgi:hypothetical protein
LDSLFGLSLYRAAAAMVRLSPSKTNSCAQRAMSKWKSNEENESIAIAASFIYSQQRPSTVRTKIATKSLGEELIVGIGSLTIDYSNGAQKHFSNIPWESGLTLLGAIEASAAIPSGAALSFSSDRSGHAIGLVIDEVPPGIQQLPNGYLGQCETL